MKRYVLIVAGGKGVRMGAGLPKQFIPMRGRPLLMHTLERFYRWDTSACLIVALPLEHHVYWEMLCREIPCTVPHQVVAGGETRFHSVKNGLALIREPGLGAVHDGVRPFVPQEVIEACFALAAGRGTAVPVVRMTDSIREVEPSTGKSRPADRSRYLAVQTPQVFDSNLLAEAYRQPYSPAFTDDASVVEAMGTEVFLAEGHPENIKVTSPFDLLVAEAIMNRQEGGA